jgi:MYXO-CTERM domain-containing protein
MIRNLLLFACLMLVATAGVAQAGVRVVHASPDAPAVDVIVNDDFANPAFVNAPFTGVTPYAALPTGMYNFKVVPTGEETPVVIDADLDIDGATDYTVAATDLLASITPVVFLDDNTLDPNNARVRFAHLSPNAPMVDIVVAGGGPTLFDDVSFQESGGYISVPGGSYDLEVRLSADDTLVLEVPGLSVANNTVYSVFAMGLAGDPTTPLQAVVAVDAVPEPAGLALLGLGGLTLLRRRR